MENIVKHLLITACFFFLLSCEKVAPILTETAGHKKINQEYLRRHAFCTCMEMVDSCVKSQDYSKGIYFEKSSYAPEAFSSVDSFVLNNKPHFNSFNNHNLWIGECLELYNSDTLKKEIERQDKYLAPSE